MGHYLVPAVSPRRRVSLVTAFAILSSLSGSALLSGCAGAPTFSSESTLSSLGAVQGKAYGGQQPVVGMRIYVLQAGTSGYGSASTSLLTTGDGSDSIGYYVKTDSNGFFSLTGNYTCTSGSQVYLYGLSGNPGAGTNDAAGMMAVLGQCPASGSMAAAVPYVWMDEVTTVAAAYSLSAFAVDPLHIGGSEGVSGNTTATQAHTGLANAFATPTNLVNIATGVALATTPAGNGTVPQSTINALANILATCVNTTGAGSAACSSLFSAATADGTSTGALPTDTAAAMINIAHNPAANVSTLYGLIPSSVPYSPSLGTLPNDWTLTVKYPFTSTQLKFPMDVAIDSQGNVWVPNNTNVNLTKMNNLGAFANTTGFTGGGLTSPSRAAIDLNDNVWVGNYGAVVSKFNNSGVAQSSTGYTGGGLVSPYIVNDVAVDASNNVWTVESSSGYGRLSKFSNAGAAISSSTGYSGVFYNTSSIAIDPSGNVYVSNANGNSFGKVNNSGVVSTGESSSGYGGGGQIVPEDIALDSSNNLWISNGSGSKLSEMSSTGTAISPTAGFTGGGLATNGSQGIAVDGLNHVWVGPMSSSTKAISEFSSAGVPIAPSGYVVIDMVQASRMSFDSSGNLWMDGAGNYAIYEMIGAGAPVVTPKAAALKYNKVGVRP